MKVLKFGGTSVGTVESLRNVKSIVESAVKKYVSALGKKVLTENNGIRGIRERVEEAKGTVKFISAKGEGFLTRIKIPV